MTTTLRTYSDPRSLPTFVAATSMSVEPEVRGMARPRVPNYAVRRVVVGVAALFGLFIAAVGTIGLLAGFGGIPASASEAPPAFTPSQVVSSVHVAQAGDTLWSISNTYRGNVAHDRYLNALIRMNDGTQVQVGQAIWLP